MAIRVTSWRLERSRLCASTVAFALTLGAGLLSRPPGAGAQARRVEVAVEQDSEVFARMRGQTTDLAVELVAVGTSWQRGDALRVWLEGDAQGVVVVADAAAGRELRRAIAAQSPGGLAASARAEAIALVVRSGLVELLASPEPEAKPQPEAPPKDAVFAVPATKQAKSTPPRPAHEPGEDPPPPSEPDAVVRAEAEDDARAEPEVSSDEPAQPSKPVEVIEGDWVEPEAPSAPSDFAWVLRPGIQAAWDGTGGRPHLAPEVGLGLRVGRIGLALVGGYGLPLESSDDTSVVELQRHHVALALSVEVRGSSATSIELALRMGAYVLSRSTSVRSADYVASPERTTYSSLTSLRARLLLALAGGRGAGHALRLGVEAGVDVVPGAPTLSYQLGDEVMDRDALWLVQPVLTVGLEYAVWP